MNDSRSILVVLIGLAVIAFLIIRRERGLVKESSSKNMRPTIVHVQNEPTLERDDSRREPSRTITEVGREKLKDFLSGIPSDTRIVEVIHMDQSHQYLVVTEPK